MNPLSALEIGWFSGNVVQHHFQPNENPRVRALVAKYCVEGSSCNTLMTRFTVTNCFGDSRQCTMRYRKKEDELVLPTGEEPHLYIAHLNMDFTVLEHATHYVRRSFHAFVKIDEVIADDFVTGWDRILYSTNGVAFRPDESPDKQLSHSIEHYLNYYLNGGNIPSCTMISSTRE